MSRPHYVPRLEDIAPQVVEAAEAFELRLAAMPEMERVQFVNELLAWTQVRIFDLMPE